jgi:hypothetical protein
VGSNGELNYWERVDEQILTGMIHTNEAWWNEFVLGCMSQVECSKPGLCLGNNIPLMKYNCVLATIETKRK